MVESRAREQGMGRGKLYPARYARQLRNPLRVVFQSPRRLVANLPLNEGSEVLELGCGPGWFSPTLAAAVPRGHVHLFDFQDTMLRMARERMSRRGAIRFSCVQGDGMALPYRDGSFDLVLIATVLGEIPDPVVCLGEVFRTLRDRGYLAISEGRNDSDFHPVQAVRALAEPLGFEFVRRHGPRWNYTALFRRA